MFVTYTNPTANPVWVSTLARSLNAGEVSTAIHRTPGQLDAEQIDKVNIQTGVITMAVSKELGDDAEIGNVAGLRDFANNAARPAPSSIPTFSAIWIVALNMTQWTDGVNWRDNAGVIVP